MLHRDFSASSVETKHHTVTRRQMAIQLAKWTTTRKTMSPEQYTGVELMHLSDRASVRMKADEEETTEASNCECRTADFANLGI
eukprot:s5113_g3.t1